MQMDSPLISQPQGRRFSPPGPNSLLTALPVDLFASVLLLLKIPEIASLCNLVLKQGGADRGRPSVADRAGEDGAKELEEVLDMILIEMKKEGKTNLANLNRSRVRKYLSKYSHLEYSKYYDNINQIIWNLSNIPPLNMSPEVEEQLCMMFEKIQDPFERHRSSNRINFLSYSYVIHKFCQLLGYTQYLSYFTLLKSKDKLHEQDKIWKKICDDLDWKYNPSR